MNARVCVQYACTRTPNKVYFYVQVVYFFDLSKSVSFTPKSKSIRTLRGLVVRYDIIYNIQYYTPSTCYVLHEASNYFGRVHHQKPIWVHNTMVYYNIIIILYSRNTPDSLNSFNTRPTCIKTRRKSTDIIL